VLAEPSSSALASTAAAATTAPSLGKGRSAKVIKFLGAASTVVASAASGPSMSSYSWEVTWVGGQLARLRAGLGSGSGSGLGSGSGSGSGSGTGAGANSGPGLVSGGR
jgi:hypothetical protein